MIVIQIKLTSQGFGGCPWHSAINEGKCEIIPSPHRICRAILCGFYNDSLIRHKKEDYLTEEQESLITKIAHSTPSYYIPTYTHTGNISYYPDYVSGLRDIVVEEKENHSSRRINFDASVSVEESDDSYYIFYDITLTASERQLLKDTFKYLTYLGRSEYPATWTLLRQWKVEPNCQLSNGGEVVEIINPDCDNLIKYLSMSPQQIKEERYRLSPAMKIGYYKLKAQRTRTEYIDTDITGQCALLALDPSGKVVVSGSKRLAITNLLHRILCVRCEGNPQVIGRYEDGEFIDPNASLYYQAEVAPHNDAICAIKLLSKKRIDDEIISALKRLRYVELSGDKIPVSLMGVAKYQPPKGKKYRTTTPALVSTEVRKSIHRSAEAIFINNILFQLGYSHKIKDFERKESFVVADLPEDMGWVKCHALPVSENEITSRGKRQAASNTGYYVTLEFEKDIELIGIGMHNHFGNGRVELF